MATSAGRGAGQSASAALEGSRSLPPLGSGGGGGGLLPAVLLYPFSGLRSPPGGDFRGGVSGRSPPVRRSPEEDIFGSSLRSMSLPGGSFSFVSPAAQLLLAPPSMGSGGATGLAVAGFAAATPTAYSSGGLPNMPTLGRVGAFASM